MTSYKEIIIVSLIFFITCNCNKKSQDTFPINHKLSSKIEKVIDSLNPIIYDNDSIRYAIGFGENGYLYEDLTKNATLNDLILLTKHKSTKVQCVSFSILANQNYPKIKNIFLQHINDSSRVLAGSGSIIGDITVAHYMLDQLHPAYAAKKYRFQRTEYDSLHKVIPRTY